MFNQDQVSSIDTDQLSGELYPLILQHLDDP